MKLIKFHENPLSCFRIVCREADELYWGRAKTTWTLSILCNKNQQNAHFYINVLIYALLLLLLYLIITLNYITLYYIIL